MKLGFINFKLSTFCYGLLIVIPLILVTSSIHQITAFLFDYFNIASNDQVVKQMLQHTSSFWKIFFLGLGAVILAPVYEEIIFRRISFALLLKIIFFFSGHNNENKIKENMRKIAAAGAAVITSLFFMILHSDSLMAMPSIFFIGLTAQLTYLHFKSIYPAIALHAANNLFTMIMVLLNFTKE